MQRKPQHGCLVPSTDPGRGTGVALGPPVSCDRNERVRQAGAGFTLIEALVVLALVGLIILVAIVPINSYWQRSRLETTAGDIRNFLQSAYFEAINQHAQVTVTLQLNATTGLWELQLNPPPPAPRTANGTFVIPAFISLADNPANTAGGWPVSASDASVRGVICDPGDRTLVPTGFAGSAAESAGQPVQEVKTLAITHVNMVDGSLQPNTRFDIQLPPIWSVTLRKVVMP
jgi:type II secretory pathway pseudopilin PulG